MDAKERPRRSRQSSILNGFSYFCVLRDPFGGRPRHALHFENEQNRIVFIHVFDALIASMLAHRNVTPKSKNERHAAWERSGTKRNERHAAWERFSCFHGPVECLKELPRRSHQTFIFNLFLLFLFFGIHLVAAPGLHFTLKICNIALVL